MFACDKPCEEVALTDNQSSACGARVHEEEFSRRRALTVRLADLNAARGVDKHGLADGSRAVRP